jgi:enoyl-CoA hydratase/carnithine racemase
MSHLRIERRGKILRLVLDHQATRNSLSETMMQMLLDAVSKPDDASVIVIASEGPAFSSGHNLKELTSHRSDSDKGEAYFVKIFGLCSKLMQSIVNSPCPVIAEVNGLASAAGCQLVASCDLAYVSDNATFCTPGVNIGLFCSTPMVALSRSVGQKHAMEMLLTGDIYSAAYAYRIGLVNAVVTSDKLSDHVMSIAQHVADKSCVAVQFGKPAFYQQSKLDLEQSYSLCSSVMVENMLSDDAREGVGAFIEKRKPKWPMS